MNCLFTGIGNENVWQICSSGGKLTAGINPSSKSASLANQDCKNLSGLVAWIYVFRVSLTITLLQKVNFCKLKAIRVLSVLSELMHISKKKKSPRHI